MFQNSLKKLDSGRINENSSSNVYKDATVYKISANPLFNTNLAEILVFINGVKVRALLDLGATKSVINNETVKKLNIHPEKSNTILKCANGNILSTVGEVELKVKLNGNYSKKIDAIVSDALSHKFILGTDFIDTLLYNKQDRFVIVNEIKMRRFLPNQLPILIRCPKTIKLKSWQNDVSVNIKIQFLTPLMMRVF